MPDGTTSLRCGDATEGAATRWLQETYPAIAEHLVPFEEKARRRGDKGQFWWELRPCDYCDAFEKPKILYPDITKSNRFHMDLGGLYSSNTTYFLPVEDWYLLGVLNSKALWFALGGISIPFGERAGEFRYRLFSQYIEKLPIPNPRDSDRDAMARLAERCNGVGQQRYVIQENFRRRLRSTFDQQADGAEAGGLNQKAEAWWELSLNQLGVALKASFKLPGDPFKNPRSADEWEPYFGEKKAEVDRLSRELSDAEGELNDRVFRLFKLTREEIRLLQREVEH